MQQIHANSNQNLNKTYELNSYIIQNSKISNSGEPTRFVQEKRMICHLVLSISSIIFCFECRNEYPMT